MQGHPPNIRRSLAEKLRKPVSFLAAALLIASLVFTRTTWSQTLWSEIMEQAGFLLIFLAVLGRVWCTLYIAGRKNRELCTTGPYELCRNPLYLFSLAGLTGICLAAGSLSTAVVATAVYLFYYRAVIGGEEQRLQAIFGDDFTRYKESTPRFFPRWIIPHSNHSLQVESRIFTRSLREVAWFLIAIVFIEIIEKLKDLNAIHCILMPF